MKITKEQEKIIKEYAKENNLTIDQVINYMVAFLQNEMGN
jgi:hypothetical protein